MEPGLGLGCIATGDDTLKGAKPKEVIASGSWLTTKGSVRRRVVVTSPEGEAHGVSHAANFERVARVERSDGPLRSGTNLEGRTPKADSG
jgi:hypothetical protein